MKLFPVKIFTNFSQKSTKTLFKISLYVSSRDLLRKLDARKKKKALFNEELKQQQQER